MNEGTDDIVELEPPSTSSITLAPPSATPSKELAPPSATPSKELAPPSATSSKKLPPPPTTTSSEVIKSKKRKIGECIEDQELATEIKATSNILRTMIEQEQQQPADGDDIFGQMVAKELKSIPESFEKDTLKLEIQRNVMLAKYNHHEGDEPSNPLSTFTKFLNM